MSYTIYIDESGDSGIKKIKSDVEAGASPYMTLGGVLVNDDIYDELLADMEELRKDITRKGSLHCCELNHEQKVRIGKFINSKDIICLGVVSLKATLGGYGNQIGKDNRKYYNKCAFYLLERLGMYVNDNNIAKGDISTIFERGNFNYTALRNFVLKCQDNPKHQNTHYLKKIEAYKIISKLKNEEPLLCLSDYIAHALYKCVYGDKLGVTESRYLNEIKSNFYSDSKTGKVMGKGIYAIHSIDDLKLDADIHSFLSSNF